MSSDYNNTIMYEKYRWAIYEQMVNPNPCFANVS